MYKMYINSHISLYKYRYSATWTVVVDAVDRQLLFAFDKLPPQSMLPVIGSASRTTRAYEPGPASTADGPKCDVEIIGLSSSLRALTVLGVGMSKLSSARKKNGGIETTNLSIIFLIFFHSNFNIVICRKGTFRYMHRSAF